MTNNQLKHQALSTVGRLRFLIEHAEMTNLELVSIGAELEEVLGKHLETGTSRTRTVTIIVGDE